MKTYLTQNVYLSAFLVSQENFKLGEIFLADDQKNAGKSCKATITIEYEEKYEPLLERFIDLYVCGKPIGNIIVYQKNIRFIMHIVNARKSGITEHIVAS